MKRALTFLMLLLAVPAFADFSVTVLPHASIRYNAEGKVIPQTYVDNFGGNTAPVYKIEGRQPRSDKGYWGLSLIHTGYFGGGTYNLETVPDLTTGGIYQTSQLNVGFTNVQATYRRPFAFFPQVEGLVELTVAREIFKRKSFVVQGVDGDGLDDVNEISAEGLGLGLAGKHGGRFYGRWEVVASQMAQIFDSKTNSAAGQIFRSEAALGWDLGKGYSIEAGGMYYYWFILAQGNRRLHLAGTDGAVISWNRQETRASGFFLSVNRRIF